MFFKVTSGQGKAILTPYKSVMYFKVFKTIHGHTSKCIITSSVRNKASPTDNDWLKSLRTDWFENLSDKFTLEQIVKMTVQSEKSWFGMRENRATMAGTLEWVQAPHLLKHSCHSGPVFSSQLNDPAIVKPK